MTEEKSSLLRHAPSFIIQISAYIEISVGMEIRLISVVILQIKISTFKRDCRQKCLIDIYRMNAYM